MLIIIPTAKLDSKMVKIMGHRRKFYGRKPSKRLGGKLKKWRKAADLTLEVAAARLGIKCKSPGSYLCLIEKGERTIPDKILVNVSRVYGKKEEEVIKQAYSPQLHFPILTEVMKPTVPSKEIDDFIERVGKQLMGADKKELATYAHYLLLRSKLSKSG